VEGDVKRRPYSSPRRREQAEQTRVRVLDAAAELFVARGYDGTSITAVAEAADVSAETVYARFKSKRALLGQVVQRAVRGDDPRPVPEQDAPRAIAASADQEEQIRLFATDIASRLHRAAPVAAVVGAASRAEPELATLYARLHENRLENLGVLVDALRRNGLLRLDRDAATDAVWALTSPELHQLLTRVRGWDQERYADWLADTVARALLP
jgi:AcrR family transcriptional regulator